MHQMKSHLHICLVFLTEKLKNRLGKKALVIIKSLDMTVDDFCELENQIARSLCKRSTCVFIDSG